MSSNHLHTFDTLPSIFLHPVTHEGEGEYYGWQEWLLSLCELFKDSNNPIHENGFLQFCLHLILGYKQLNEKLINPQVTTDTDALRTLKRET